METRYPCSTPPYLHNGTSNPSLRRIMTIWRPRPLMKHTPHYRPGPSESYCGSAGRASGLWSQRLAATWARIPAERSIKEPDHDQLLILSLASKAVGSSPGSMHMHSCMAEWAKRIELCPKSICQKWDSNPRLQM